MNSVEGVYYGEENCLRIFLDSVELIIRQPSGSFTTIEMISSNKIMSGTIPVVMFEKITEFLLSHRALEALSR